MATSMNKCARILIIHDFLDRWTPVWHGYNITAKRRLPLVCCGVIPGLYLVISCRGYCDCDVCCHPPLPWILYWLDGFAFHMYACISSTTISQASWCTTRRHVWILMALQVFSHVLYSHVLSCYTIHFRFSALSFWYSEERYVKCCMRCNAKNVRHFYQK